MMKEAIKFALEKALGKGTPGGDFALERLSPNARMEKVAPKLSEALQLARDQRADETFKNMTERIDCALEALEQIERERAIERLTSDPNALEVLGLYAEEAHREPLDERRRMLEFAAAGIADIGLSLGELLQIWRVLRELDPADIRKLYALWLVPAKLVRIAEKDGGGTLEPDQVRAGLLTDDDVDSLLASGAVAWRTPSRQTWGAEEKPLIVITKRGRLILSGLRAFLLTFPPQTSVPGHAETREMRTRGEADRFLAEYPSLHVLRRYQNRRFVNGLVGYDAPQVASGEHAHGMAHLNIAPVLEEDVLALKEGILVERRQMRIGEPVVEIWINSIDKHDGGSMVQLRGPHDVLRFLAYDLFAVW